MVGDLRSDVLRALQGVKGGKSQGFHVKKLFSRGLLHNVIVSHVHLFCRAASQHKPGIIQNPGLQLLRAFLDSHTGHIGLAGCIRPCVKWGCICVLCGYNIHFFQGNAGCLSCHLAECSVSTLSYFRGSQLKLHGAVLIQYHPGGGSLQ